MLVAAFTYTLALALIWPTNPPVPRLWQALFCLLPAIGAYYGDTH